MAICRSLVQFLVLWPAILYLAFTCSVLQLLAYSLRAFGREREYLYCSRVIYAILHRPISHLFSFSGSRTTAHGASTREALGNIGADQGIILCNHTCSADWILGLLVLDWGASQRGFSFGISCCKAIIKNSLLLVPFLGFIWWGNDFVNISRDWASDARVLERGFGAQHAYRKHGFPYCLTIFPESTKVTPEKLLRSQALMKQKNLPFLKHLLFPHSKAAWSALRHLELDSVYDVLVVASGDEDDVLWTMVSGRSADVHFHIERVVPSAIPREEEAMKQWLLERWRLKDERLERWKKEGRLTQNDGNLPDGSDLLTPVSVVPSSFLHFYGAMGWWLLSTLAFVRGHALAGEYWMILRCAVGLAFGVTVLYLVLGFQTQHGKAAAAAAAARGTESTIGRLKRAD